MWKANILTLLPKAYPGLLGMSVVGRALVKKIWDINLVDIKKFSSENNKVDDPPFGGGPGMVLRPDVLDRAISSVPDSDLPKYYLSPRGEKFNQEMAIKLSKQRGGTFICGRYEGVDQRVLDVHNFEEISIGDYVLSGGEPAAIILMDACIRLLDGVMGNNETVNEESFSNGLLEYPHYTKPDPWVDAHGNTHAVPETLKSGHHKNINAWRQEKSLELILSLLALHR